MLTNTDQDISYITSDSILQLLHYLPDPIFLKDIHGKIINCNQSLLEKFNLAEKQIHGLTEAEIRKNPKDASLYQQYDDEVIRTQKPILNTKEVLTFSQNKPEIINVSRVPLINKNNEVVGIFVIYALTERIDSTLRLIFNHLIESLPYYIFWKDKNSIYLGCNHNFAAVMGNKVENIVGKTDFDVGFGLDEAEFFRAADQKVMQGETQVNEEELLKRPGGSDMTVLVSKVPIKNERGDVIGMLGMSTDITPQKKTQQELEKAKIEAEIANKAKSEFIANMSHDIRTPITGILGLAQSLYDNATENEAKNDAKTLISSTNELLSLLNEIIDVIGLSSKEMEAKEEDFSLRQIVIHNINLLKPAIKHKKLTISLSINSHIPDCLYGNRRYLDRILLNLLSNAVKFTDKGSIELTVSATYYSKQKAKLKFAIRDTGIGIAKNKKKIIFQHFSRLNPSYQGLYKGSGLGLYTVKQYLLTMGGSIRVSSKEGEGSTFTLTIPFSISKEKSPIESSTHFTIEPASSNHENPITILAVEDNLLAARILQQTLQKLNCIVNIVNSGEEALNNITHHDYDLVLMDIGLPGISGFETTQRIRQLKDKFKAHVPIVALTAHISEQMRQQCLDIGMQDMLTKPVTPLSLQQTLEKFLPTTPSPEATFSPILPKENNLLTIDLEDSANISGGDINFAKKMLTMFVESLPNDLAQIQAAHKQKDFTLLAKLAHKIYGGLCYCGVPKLRQLITQLQSALKTNQYDEIDSLMIKLEEESAEILRVWKSLKYV